MPRRNRVDPWGDLHSASGRGLFTGNRGCLVDETGRLLRHHNGSLWITCRIQFRDWSHPLDAPRTWTPLFFLDDAVALAAGHRPCGLCRRDDYLAYRDAVTLGIGTNQPLMATELNRHLAAERHRQGRGLTRAQDRILTPGDLETLPTGTVVVHPSTNEPHLVIEDRLQPFSFAGWGPAIDRPNGVPWETLTPPTSIIALAGGFVPQLHPTAVSPPGPARL